MKNNVLLAIFENGFSGISIRYLSSWVKHLGHSCKLLFTCKNRGTYQSVKYFSDEEIDGIVSFLQRNTIDIFGMSIMTGDYLSAIELADKPRNFLPA